MISYFPVLTTGTMTQLPVRRTRRLRAVTNELQDGSVISFADATANRTEWTLTYAGLSDAEADALRAFFESMEGTLGTFTFIDPGMNLLAWSGDLTQQAWDYPATLKVMSTKQDPFAGASASTLLNTGAGLASVSQDVNVPGSMPVTFGAYVRGASSQNSLQITRIDGTASIVRLYQVGARWQQIAMTSSLAGANGNSTFSLTVSPGNQIDVYGITATAQPALSLYCKTSAHSGIYENTRFGSDTLALTRTGLNQNACQLSLVSMD